MFWSFRCRVWGAVAADYELVSRREWQYGANRASRLRDFEVLDLLDARSALAAIAGTREGRQVLRKIAEEVLPYFYSINPPPDSYEAAAEDRRRLAELTRELGSHSGEPGEPPVFASFYICRRRQPAHTPQPLPDPWKSVREAIGAAKAAPRGYVTIEAVTEDEEPVPQLRLEVLLADGEVLSRSTDASGRLHLEPIPQGRCTVRVAAVDGAAWRPSTGSAALVEQRYKQAHAVRRGERLGDIARLYGFYDWHKLWSASENDALREQRREPQWIRPGDQVMIPGIQIHQVVWPTDQTHHIVLRERPDEASVFVVTPYTRADLERGHDAELTLSGPRYSQTLMLSTSHTPVSDYFGVHFVELEFKGVPTNGRYLLKMKPQGGEEHALFEDVPFAALMGDAHAEGKQEYL
jgi:hypothetical protein